MILDKQEDFPSFMLLTRFRFLVPSGDDLCTVDPSRRHLNRIISEVEEDLVTNFTNPSDSNVDFHL